MAAIFDLFRDHKEKPHRLPAWRSDLPDTIGYGVVNQWHKLSRDDNRRGLEAMADSGMGRYKIELLGEGRDSYYDRPADLAGKLADLYDATHDRRIVLDLTIVNWNVGGGGVAENGETSICNIRFNDDWFMDILKMVKDVGLEGISICPASEWGPGSRNSACWRKADSWKNRKGSGPFAPLAGMDAVSHVNGLLSDNWLGMKTWNRESRPHDAPSGYGIEYHPNSVNDMGPAGCLLVSDTSGILAQLCRGGDIRAPFDPAKAAEWVRRCRDAGRGAVLYGFGHSAFDLPTIAALKGIR